MNKIAFALFAWYFVFPPAAGARTLFVNTANGDDNAPGLSAAQSFKTIQKAADVIEPGDEVQVLPGIYYEHVRITRCGTPEKAIHFTVAPANRGRVVISGGNPTFRQGKAVWTLEEASLGLYSTPFTHRPLRLLVDGGDLFPYDDLSGLKTFRTWLDGAAVGYPGPLQGFAFDPNLGKLFVRLHPGGRYGNTNPSGRHVSTSPTLWSGKGDQPGMGPDYGFRFQPNPDGAPGYLILEGFVFEGNAAAGVSLKGSSVTVRHCRFEGVRHGVSGNFSSPNQSTGAHDITVEHCEYHQWPAFDDMVEVIEKYEGDTWRGARTNLNQKIYWWHRKNKGTGKWNYETGLISSAGRNWLVRRNHIHDCFEAIAGAGGAHSQNLRFEENLVERVIDNAFETEDHSQGFTARSNLIIDTFEPVSWQPLDGEPWPGSIRVEDNLFFISEKLAKLWRFGSTPGIFKMGQERGPKPAVLTDPWPSAKVSGTGFTARGNRVYAPGHNLFTTVQPIQRSFENFFFQDNQFSVADGGGRLNETNRGLVFAGNKVFFNRATNMTALQTVSAHGQGVSSNSAPGGFSSAVLSSWMGPRWLGPEKGFTRPRFGTEVGPDFRSGKEPVAP